MNGQSYNGCHNDPEITWKDIFNLFDLKHPQLNRLGGGNPLRGDKNLEDNSEFHKKDNNEVCYRPHSVVRSLILNDFVEVSLEPIAGLDLDKFVDSPETSGLDKETFFGPVTFLLNGNGSTMRSTRNISESKCEHIDCDAFKTEKDFRELRDRWKEKMGKNVDKHLNRVYDHSKYFHSMRYLNNMHVDDLILQMKEEDRHYEVMQGAKSQLYYYLRQYNLDFLSMSDEDLYEVDILKCQRKLSVIDSIEPCLEKTDHHKLAWKDFDNGSEDLREDVNDLINNLRVSKPLGRKYVSISHRGGPPFIKFTVDMI